MHKLAEIPRSALIWLLLAQGFIVLLQVPQLPVWILVLWAACSIWRVQVLRMRWPYPGRWSKALLVLAAGSGVYLSRGQLVGLDAGVVLLVAAFLLKLLEMRTQRDAWVLIFIGFFVLGTTYLFDSGLLLSVLSLVPLLLLLAAMIALQQRSVILAARPTLKLASSLLLQALPLMLVLFVFFPRMGPLWSLPLPSDKGITGLSESMSPNDIAELSRSDALAFRATFETAPPAREQLYWRALTLERFDGRTWHQLPQPPAPQVMPTQLASYRYQVVAQPTGQNWLFALDAARSSTAGVELMLDGRLQAAKPLEQTMRYEVLSWPEQQLPGISSERQMQRLLQLPETGEPRARAWAQQLREDYANDQELVAAMLRHFNQQPYVYTLKPPLLGQNAIDGFLFESQRGFCAHYAGAMVFVLRAAKIPSRVVAGYQGGELGPGPNTLQVRQFDAHAWVEYWTPEHGWQAVDPTAAVAPERIELGLEAALQQEQSFLEDSPFSPLRYRHIGWLNQLRLGWDRLDYGWQQWVLNYQAQEQQGFLQRWFGRGLDGRLLLGVSLFSVLLLLALALYLLKPWRRELTIEQRLFARFEKILLGKGLVREAGEGPKAFAQRAKHALPEQAASINAFEQAYIARCYAAAEVDLAQLKQLLKQLARACRN